MLDTLRIGCTVLEEEGPACMITGFKGEELVIEEFTNDIELEVGTKIPQSKAKQIIKEKLDIEPGMTKEELKEEMSELQLK